MLGFTLHCLQFDCLLFFSFQVVILIFIVTLQIFSRPY